MATKLKSSNGRQTCGRCHEDLTPGAFSPSRRGKVGKWCRQCFRAYRKMKKGAKKPAAPREVKKASQASAA